MSNDDETRSVKVHRVTLLIVDHDGLGAAGCALEIENAHYPNRCISPSVLGVETRTVEWHDRHPLNITTTTVDAAEALFADKEDRR